MTTSSLDPKHPHPTTEDIGRDTRRLHAAHDAKVAPGEIAIGVIIGRSSEYFDFFVFGIAAVLVFPSVFFPFEKGLEGTLWAFTIFSFAFIARPIGSIIFMAIQKRYGREAKLTIALFLLGSSTAGMAFVPGYQSIGFTSIVLLSIFRVGQGLALGGAWDGLPSLLALNAPSNRRGWYAMLGQLGAPIGFVIASGLFAFLYASLSSEDFLSWGWRYPFYVAFAINVVALFARLRLVATNEYAKLLDAHELEPTSVGELARTQGSTIVIGAFAALASYALFHIVTVFPLSWIKLYSTQSISEFLAVQMVGAGIAALGIIASGSIADRFGRRTTLGTLAAAIGVFSGFAPTLLGGGPIGQDVFILVGFALLGLSYGQASGAVTSNFETQHRYTGAALTSDLAWLIGAAFAPLVALGLSAHFGLAYVSVYLLSGSAATLIALSINKAMEIKDSAAAEGTSP
ncbi:MFS transporter [Rhizobacter sp. OV335]|uniref:MFS transporter n=1 Tax=Rhizobacter sp. OV335 TaxID=1500264 RepID=UPI00091F6D29|nr:MFS transporter [Rhizobacter sp. OV335]SHM60329.1 Predicted arabinose efflux permease, MFS family [Rhizobacter sp. OV335]